MTLPTLSDLAGRPVQTHGDALELLDDQLGLLALECVRSGGENNYLSFLRAQAETYLMLKLGKARGDLRRADHAALPERVRQVLAAGQP